ncbi:hypothetical protein WR25_19213 [Diploscapter pachys]|uniref:non-specific serine/threonine protein kinase n=1 Tax=Diploscapter pachys TaxID=2018661 RepID=A0A2A2KRQ1_9BILA|nr:hypothetical protein WR25_19213 [Diploscapter pachys]
MNTGDILCGFQGQYEISSQLGRGSFGIVYLTEFTPHSSSICTTRAIKEIAVSNNPYCKGFEACLKEAEIMEQISCNAENNNIVKCYESFPRGYIAPQSSLRHKSLFIAMEYCTGGDLASKIRETQRNISIPSPYHL